MLLFWCTRLTKPWLLAACTTGFVLDVGGKSCSLMCGAMQASPYDDTISFYSSTSKGCGASLLQLHCLLDSLHACTGVVIRVCSDGTATTPACMLPAAECVDGSRLVAGNSKACACDCGASKPDYIHLERSYWNSTVQACGEPAAAAQRNRNYMIWVMC
jgi:hypothetical protein